MRNVLIYGDGLSWGLIPGTTRRLSFEKRWGGVLESAINAQNKTRVRIVENCLPGRSSAWDDPLRPGRNGLKELDACIESQSPLAIAIIMLGTWDLLPARAASAQHSAQGIAAIAKKIQALHYTADIPMPEILIVSPPPLGTPSAELRCFFEGAAEKSLALALAYREICHPLNCHFFAAGNIVSPSEIDGVHLEEAQHHALGSSLVPIVEWLMLQAAQV